MKKVFALCAFMKQALKMIATEPTTPSAGEEPIFQTSENAFKFMNLIQNKMNIKKMNNSSSTSH